MIAAGLHVMSRMMNLRARLLLGLCALLAIALATELSLFADVERAVERGHAQTAAPAVPQNVSTPHAVRIEAFIAYREVLRRPLFTPLRRAQSDVSGGSTGAEQVASRWRLTGVVLNADATLAILHPRAGGATARPLKLRPGDSLEGWQLTVIASDHVTLASGRDTLELRLREPPAAVSGAAAALDPRRQRRSDAKRGRTWTPAN